MTDGEIAQVDRKSIGPTELIPWQADEDGLGGDELEAGGLDSSLSVSSSTGHNGIMSSNHNSTTNGGWNEEDMFNFNKSNFNIQSTYKEDMSDYTYVFQIIFVRYN